jgi:hypothetical protein
LKITAVAHVFGLILSKVDTFDTQNGLGYILGDLHKLILDRCCDFKNIFAEKFGEIIGVL